MAGQFVMRLLALVLVMSSLFTTPEIVNALTTQLDIAGNVNITKVNEAPKIDLTPRQSQRLQAMHQGRNRKIGEVLNVSQKSKLLKYLREGNSLNQAIDKLKLTSEQSDIVKAIGQLYDLKIKALTSGF